MRAPEMLVNHQKPMITCSVIVLQRPILYETHNCHILLATREGIDGVFIGDGCTARTEELNGVFAGQRLTVEEQFKAAWPECDGAAAEYCLVAVVALDADAVAVEWLPLQIRDRPCDARPVAALAVGIWHI